MFEHQYDSSKNGQYTMDASDAGMCDGFPKYQQQGGSNMIIYSTSDGQWKLASQGCGYGTTGVTINVGGTLLTDVRENDILSMYSMTCAQTGMNNGHPGNIH